MELISRNAKFLYKETDQSNSNDELQMLIDGYIEEMAEILKVETKIRPKELNPLNN